MHQLCAWPVSRVHKLSTFKSHKFKGTLSSPPVCKCSRSERNMMWRWMFILLEGLALHLTLSSKAGWRIICCIMHVNLCLCVDFVCILHENICLTFCGKTPQHQHVHIQCNTSVLFRQMHSKMVLFLIPKIGKINCCDIILYFDRKWQEVLWTSTLFLFGVVNIALPEALCGWHLCYT